MKEQTKDSYRGTLMANAILQAQYYEPHKVTLTTQEVSVKTLIIVNCYEFYNVFLLYLT